MALTVDMPTSFVILIGGVYKSLLRDDDPDSEVDLATSYPNSKFIAILPSDLIQAVQVDPLFKLAKQIVGGKIGRKAAKLVHYLIIYYVGDIFPVDKQMKT